MRIFDQQEEEDVLKRELDNTKDLNFIRVAGLIPTTIGYLMVKNLGKRHHKLKTEQTELLYEKWLDLRLQSANLERELIDAEAKEERSIANDINRRIIEIRTKLLKYELSGELSSALLQNGIYSLPGGGMDIERDCLNPRKTIMREIEEELNLKIGKIALVDFFRTETKLHILFLLKVGAKDKNPLPEDIPTLKVNNNDGIIGIGFMQRYMSIPLDDEFVNEHVRMAHHRLFINPLLDSENTNAPVQSEGITEMNSILYGYYYQIAGFLSDSFEDFVNGNLRCPQSLFSAWEKDKAIGLELKKVLKPKKQDFSQSKQSAQKGKVTEEGFISGVCPDNFEFIDSDLQDSSAENNFFEASDEDDEKFNKEVDRLKKIFMPAIKESMRFLRTEEQSSLSLEQAQIITEQPANELFCVDKSDDPANEEIVFRPIKKTQSEEKRLCNSIIDFTKNSSTLPPAKINPIGKRRRNRMRG